MFLLRLSVQKIGIFTTWAWINFWEILMALPTGLYVLPVIGLPLTDYFTNLRDGYLCLFTGDAPQCVRYGKFELHVLRSPTEAGSGSWVTSLSW